MSKPLVIALMTTRTKPDLDLPIGAVAKGGKEIDRKQRRSRPTSRPIERPQEDEGFSSTNDDWDVSDEKQVA